MKLAKFFFLFDTKENTFILKRRSFNLFSHSKKIKEKQKKKKIVLANCAGDRLKSYSISFLL